MLLRFFAFRFAAMASSAKGRSWDAIGLATAWPPKEVTRPSSDSALLTAGGFLGRHGGPTAGGVTTSLIAAGVGRKVFTGSSLHLLTAKCRSSLCLAMFASSRAPLEGWAPRSRGDWPRRAAPRRPHFPSVPSSQAGASRVLMACRNLERCEQELSFRLWAVPC